MGRIDEALRRSNVKTDPGAGIPASAAHSSPWSFEDADRRQAAEPGREAPERAGGSRRESAVETSPERVLIRDDAPPEGWHGFDVRALERLVVSTAAAPLMIEQFRSLAASLHQVQRERALKSIIVTSAAPGDGKSHVAVNLALTLSDSYRRRVLLIDADQRRPSLHRIFGVPNISGLSEALNATTNGNLRPARISDTLALLPAGLPEPNPLGGLSSDRMKRILEDAVSKYDWVIVDAPPVGVLADARLVSEAVDAALLVIRAGVTQFPDLEAASDMLGNERILGVVLNAVEPAEIRGKDYYHRYYARERSNG